MSNPATPAATPATPQAPTVPQIVQHFHAPVANAGTADRVAQAAAPGSQAAAGSIHNHPAQDAAMASLLDAFLAAVKSAPELANKQAYVEQRVQELRTLSQAPAQDVQAPTGAQRALEDLSNVMDRVEQGSALMAKFIEVKDAVLAHWPTLTAWAAGVFGASGS